jgi:hypothetical protein
VVKSTTAREFVVLYSDFEYGSFGHGDSVNKSILQHDQVHLQGLFTISLLLSNYEVLPVF